MGGFDELARAQDDRPLDDVAQLAYVSRPRSSAEASRMASGASALHGFAVAGVELADERFDQQGNVFEAIAQRRHADADDVDAVVEVFAELPCWTVRRVRLVAAIRCTSTACSFSRPSG